MTNSYNIEYQKIKGSDLKLFRPKARITERQIEILKCVAEGMTTADVANTLKIAERTVDCHLWNVMGTLNVKTRTGAVIKAMQEGYFSTGELDKVIGRNW